MSVVDVTLDFLRARDFTPPASVYGWTAPQDQLARMLRRGMSMAEVATASGRSLAAVEADAATLATDLGVHTSALRSALDVLEGDAPASIDIDHFRTAFGLEPER